MKSDLQNVVMPEHVSPLTERDFYVLMVRYGNDYWSALQTYVSMEQLQANLESALAGTGKVWKVIKVTLPIAVIEGEA